jgi:hypothetical protein
MRKKITNPNHRPGMPIKSMILRLEIQVRQYRARMGATKHATTKIRYQKAIANRVLAIKYLNQNPKTQLSFKQITDMFGFAIGTR